MFIANIYSLMKFVSKENQKHLNCKLLIYYYKSILRYCYSLYFYFFHIDNYYI